MRVRRRREPSRPYPRLVALVAGLAGWLTVPASPVSAEHFILQCDLPAAATRAAGEVALQLPLVIPRGHRLLAAELDAPASQGGMRQGKAAPPRAVRVLGSGAWLGYSIGFVELPAASVVALTESGVRRVQLEVETRALPAAQWPLQRRRLNPALAARERERVRRFVANPQSVFAWGPPPGKAVAVPRGFQPAAYPDLEGSDVEYLIVTSAALAPAFQALADWKTRRGVPSVVRTIEDIVATTRQGSDLQETVRNYLQEAWSNWSLQWVLLGGDTDILPARYLTSSFSVATPEAIPSDLYFAGLDGNWNANGNAVWGEAPATGGVPDPDGGDLLAEVHVGRAPVLSPADVGVFVQKVIDYETPADPTYQDQNLFLAEVLFPADWNGSQTITMDGGTLSEDLINLYFPAPQLVKRRYEDYAAFPLSLPLTRAASLADLDSGFNLVNHMGHGFRYNMSVGDASIVNADADTRANGTRLSVLNVLNCTSLAFDFSCLGEHFTNAPNGGAVAVLGASRSAYPLTSRDYQDEFYELLFTQGVHPLGVLFSDSRLPQTPQAALEGAHRWTHYIYNLIGDPELNVYSALPRPVSVQLPAGVDLGTTPFVVTVTDSSGPVAGARVCLQKGIEDYVVAQTDSAGTAAVSFRAESPGSIEVTVSGPNLQTWLGTLPVNAASAPYVHLESLALDDGGAAGTVGNQDGVLDAGETVDYAVTLRNDGGSTATVVSGSVAITDPWVSVVDGVLDLASLAPGTTSPAAAPVRVSVSPSAPDGHVFEIVVSLADTTGNVWEDRIKRVVHAPALEARSLQILDALTGNANGVPDNGETFDVALAVSNRGSGSVDGLTAVLQATNPFAFQVLQGSTSYGSIAAGGQASASPTFRIRADFVDGSTLNLRLTDGFGRLVVLPVDLLRPSTPPAPSPDPSTSPTVVLLTWTPVGDADLAGYAVYRALSPGGPWTQVTVDPTPVSYYRDTGLQPSTRYYYYITALDTSGNASAASPTATTSTNPPQLEGWPITMLSETSSSPALGDLDGDGLSEIVQGNFKVYAWHADGQEILDADNDAQTWGVFQNQTATTTASVALGELDGSAGLEVISCNWATNEVFAIDGDGTLLWTQQPLNGGAAGYWGTPAVADVDRDGDAEVFAASKDGHLYAWNHDGTPLLPANTDGTFALVAAWTRSSPALGNLDDDFELEIVLTDVLGKIHVWDPDGTPLPGFPIDTGQIFYSSPVLGDVDADGRLEIVAMAQSSTANLHVLRGDATELPGFPLLVTQQSASLTPTPALADLDADGTLEIVVGSNSVVLTQGKVYVFHADGTTMSGWPKSTGTDSESSPIVADVNGDGAPDIIFGGQDGVLHAWSTAGVELDGFPLSVGDFVRGTPSAGDVDGDGDVDLVFAGWDKNIYVWDLQVGWNPAASPWPAFLHDAARSGTHGHVVEDATDTEGAPPRRLHLFPNVPNPFNPSTQLVFSVPPQAGGDPVRLVVHDVRGRRVRLLVDQPLAAGVHRVTWNGRDDAGRPSGSGVYYVNLRWGDETRSRRIVLLK